MTGGRRRWKQGGDCGRKLGRFQHHRQPPAETLPVSFQALNTRDGETKKKQKRRKKKRETKMSGEERKGTDEVRLTE